MVVVGEKGNKPQGVSGGHGEGEQAAAGGERWSWGGK